MTFDEDKEAILVREIIDHLEQSDSIPLGDNLEFAISKYEQLEDPDSILLAYEALRIHRTLINRAEPGTQFFTSPPQLPRGISNREFIQLYRLGMGLHELCYCCEMIQNSADMTSGGSTPTRFFLNGIYSYISSLFLIDRKKPSNKNLFMGGKAIRILNTIGKTEILLPIQEILNEPIGESTLGELILQIRHTDLVHGDFAPERMEFIIGTARLRDPKQQELFSQLIWRFFHRLIILFLKVDALLESSGKDVTNEIMIYLQEKHFQ